MQPSAHMSMPSFCAVPSQISGAQYVFVPQTVLSSLSPSTIALQPKSHILSSSRAVKSMFSSLRSR
eukprot:CAMPEP_0171274718 /NCGR_PEP_ID=MMETSP0790-20130122/62954_1 /TAXON_ID=2925 /ORGANISM="Alexandrium catenella, Strain OF101" /LENGTH=65 /DNA_ID=CAMNT_0011743765 /DNA_START=1 /DNA_END=198 /DNA_ORIENTATION=+